MIDNDKVIGQLNSFLRGELSAVETYRQALDKLKESPSRARLDDCYRSHEQRVVALRERIVELGGKPSEGSGAWGAFAKVLQAGADVLGEKPAIAALEEGEDHGLADYKRDLSDLDVQSRQLVEKTLLPAQQKTHAEMSSLKHTLH